MPSSISPKEPAACCARTPHIPGHPQKGHVDVSLSPVKNVPNEYKFSAEVHRYIGIRGLFVWFGVLCCSLPLKQGFDL